MPTNLTRIKNNQITDSTILANVKIVPGSIVGSLFNSNLTMTSDVTITGNLTVQGSSTYLTVASTNTYVNDPLIVMNNAYTGTNTYDIGFLFNRGTDTNQAIIWNEAQDEFRLISTNETGTTFGNVTALGWAKLHLGDVDSEGQANLTNVDVTGSFTGVDLTLSGDLAVDGGDFTSNAATFNLLTADVTTLSAFNAVTSANVGASTGTFTLNNPTLVGSQASQDIYNTVATTVNFAGAATALNIGANSGLLSLNNANIWLPNATSVDGTQASLNFFVQNATSVNAFTFASTLSLGGNGTTTLNAPTVVGAQATQNLYNTVVNTLNFAGEANVLNIGASTGTVTVNNANLYLPNATTIYTGQTNVDFATATSNLTIGATSGTTNVRNNLDVDLTVSARDINGTVIGNVTAASGRFSAIYDTSSTDTAVPFVSAGGLVYDATFNFNYSEKHLTVNNLKFDGSNNVISTTNTNANLVLSPNGTGSIDVDSSRIVQVSDPLDAQDAVTLSYLQTALNSSVTQIISDNTDVVVTDDGVNAGVITANVDGVHVLAITSSSAAFFGNTSVDSLIFADDSAGNVAVMGDFYVQDDVTVAAGGQVSILDTTASTDTTTGAAVVTGGVGIGGNLNVGGNVVVNGPVTLTNTTDASSSTNGGALTVAGGFAVEKSAYFGSNVTIEGNLFITGNVTSFDTNNLTVTDSIIELHYHGGNLYNGDDGRDIGIRFHYYKATNDNAFLGWANDSGYLEWYGSGVTESNAATITGTYGSFKTGNIFLYGNTTATSKTTGALVIHDTGGLGVGGNIWLGGPDLATDNTTFNVIDTNATTVNAFGAATTLNIGASSGNLTLGNPTVVGTHSTQDLYNTVATTMNFAGAATTLTVGAASGTATINNATLNIAGNANVQQTTDSTSPDTGAFTVLGGVGIGANLFVGGQNLGTDETTFNLINTAATTLNIGGVATTLTLGATTGTLNLENANIWLPNATSIDGAQTTVDVLNNATTVEAFTGATTANIGAGSGTLTINNPTVVGQQAAQDLYNTVATTMNFAGAATTLIMGAVSGTATINNATIDLQGNVNINQPTDSTNTSSGALVVDGGVGVTGNVHAGNIFATGITGTLQTAAQPNITSLGNLVSLTVDGNISAPRLLSTSTQLQAPTAGNYVGERVRLYDFANAAKTNYALGVEGSHVWMGVDTNLEAQGFKWYGDTTQVMRLSAAGNLYLWGSATVTTNVNVAGTLVVDTNADINELVVTASTASVDSSTGALVVTGGVGLGANLNVAGGAVVNRNNNSESFQVKGTYANALIYTNAVTDTVTIGGSNLSPISGATLWVNGTGAMVVPQGTTSERPGTAGNIDVSGMVRFNTSTNILEYYNGTAWQNTSTDFTVIAVDSFSGNGVQTVFTLNAASTTAGALVSINGVVQIPTTSYSITGTTLTFTEAPAAGDEIDVRRYTTSKTVTEVLFLYNGFRANATHASISTGTSSYNSRILVDTAGKITLASEIEYQSDSIQNQPVTNVPLAGAAVVIDQFATSSYTGAKYLVQIKENASNKANLYEMLLIHDNSSANLVVTGSAVTASAMGTFTANIQSGDVKLWYTSSSITDSNVRVSATYIK